MTITDERPVVVSPLAERCQLPPPAEMAALGAETIDGTLRRILPAAAVPEPKFNSAV